MKYYVRIFDEWGEETRLYNKYDQKLSLKVDESGFLKIPEGTFAENGYPFKVSTNAVKVICNNSNICELQANNATYVECENCDIHWLEADKVETLKCRKNPLNVIYTPEAKEIECERCSNVEEINAPKLEKLSCSECQFSYTIMEDINFPMLKELNLQDTNLTEIKLPNLKKLNSNGNKLTNLELPNVDFVLLMNEHYLKILDIPNANNVSCKYSSVGTIICEKAQEINLVENRFLAQVFANRVQHITIFDCDNIDILKIPKDTDIQGISKTMETIFNLRR